MELGIEGRVALVMGGSSGIGRGIAAALAREGCRVAIASRSAAKLESACAEINASAGKEPVTPFVADSLDLGRVGALPAEVAGVLGGPVQICVANTGGPPRGGAFDHGVDEWEAAYRSLVLALRALVESVIGPMREGGWGRIVNVGSSSTREPIPALNLSNSHRMAAVGYLKSVSQEVAAQGVTVNTIATGRFATERLISGYGSLEAAKTAARDDVPARRLGTPEEYGDLVAFICSARAAYLTGTVIPLDGGMLRSV